MDTHESDDVFVKDFKREVDDTLILEWKRNMPFRLVDTYTGLLLERSQIVSLLKTRWDYRAKLNAAAREAKRSEVPDDSDSPCPPDSERPMFCKLKAFIDNFLAFAMFSHHWQGPEPTFSDVQAASRGIYSMGSRNLDEELANVGPPSKNDLIKKHQEFCCVAAKCGFRWAWSDTCCINRSDYAELSESINSMFLWYHSSDLTIVYLEDVDDVEDGRLPALDGKPWYKDTEIRTPHTSTPQTSSNTPPYLSLHDRLVHPTLPPLRTMHPDTQVDALYLQSLLDKAFPDVKRLTGKGFYGALPVWVLRGWTLLEMLASKRLRFYSKKWTLLEEAQDCGTDDEECAPSLRSRARLLDHRKNGIWADALSRTTRVSIRDLQAFEPGAKDVNARLCWMKKRKTTKVEDMAYCLLGIFNVNLPIIYGEGPRAFLRLQDEIMKHTGDLSLFDWCGRSSSFNSFLAHGPECFDLPNPPEPIVDDAFDSIFHMVIDLIREVCGMVWGGLKALASRAAAWIRRIIESPPPAHALVNGELSIPLFEHPVKCCEPIETAEASDQHFQYKLEVDGLMDTTVTFASEAHHLVSHPTQYYLCRTWSRHAQNVFHMFLDLLEYTLQDNWAKSWEAVEYEESDVSEPSSPVEKDEPDAAELNLREEMRVKRRAVMRYFQEGFPVYLVRVKGEQRVRVSTVKRVTSGYCGFKFTLPVTTRSIL